MACPSSNIVTGLSKKSLNTCAAVVGDTWLKRFADGAAIGTPDSSINSNANSWFGIQIPMKPEPEDNSNGINSAALHIIVRGPGQNLAANSSKTCFSFSFSLIRFKAALTFYTWTIKGSVRGLSFTVNMLKTAALSSAFAPSPYTVSVGKATSSPCFIFDPAAFTFSLEALII